MQMIIVIMGVISIICFIYILEINTAVKKNEKAMNKIMKEWNTIQVPETDENTLRAVWENYNCIIEKNDNEIDDITWNDLEMDGVFRKFNYTKSFIGEISLYKILRNPIYNIDILKERERIIDVLYTNQELRNKIQLQLMKIGKYNHLSIWEYKKFLYGRTVEFYKLWPHRFFPLFLIISVLIIPINTIAGVGLTVLGLSFTVVTYYRDRAKIEGYIPMVKQLGMMLNSIKGLSETTNIAVIDQYTRKLSKGVKLTKKYNRYLSKIQTTIGGNTTETDTLIDYIRIITHMDLIAFVKVIAYIDVNFDLIQECYEIVGYFDSMLSIALSKRQHNLKYGNKLFLSSPGLSTTKQFYLKAIDIYNPLLENPVLNSINMKKSILITGSNATGKSTFLRTIGINAVLAQTIFLVCAHEYNSSLFKIFTSMNIKDNIFEASSCYMMEIKSIKRILDARNNNITVLCCLDEVLRGTNTIERIGASSEILKSIALSNVLCIAATHDIELTYILKAYYENYHFQEKVTKDDVIFDFCLYKDRSYTRNAISLLRLLGYSDEIVSNAIKKVDSYINTGKWQ